MNTIVDAVIYMFHVRTIIILLNVLVINSEAQTQTGYFTTRNYTWKAAKESCTMIGLLDKVNVTGNTEQLAWVDASVEYTTWVEYKGCVHIENNYIKKLTNVSHGDQLLQCLQTCKDNTFIGLQHTKCACLNLSEVSSKTVKAVCSENEAKTCREDQHAYCAMSQTAFVIYKKVNIRDQLLSGNCLGVSGAVGHTKHFKAYTCDVNLSPLCTSDLGYPNGQTLRQPAKFWIDSIIHCIPEKLVTYNVYNLSDSWYTGHFWLGNTRRPIIKQSEVLDPKYCLAVSLRRDDHQVFRYVKPCNTKLPALCADSNILFTETSTGVELKDERTNSILLIALILTTLIALAVVIAVVILCIRRYSLRSGNQPNPVPNNEITYAQVNKPTKEKTTIHAGDATRNNTADDTYDHMEHHRVSQNQIPTESNYDTMQSVGNGELENDYDVTSGTDNPRQIVVDDTADYSHMEGEVDYQEIKDVST